MLSFLDLFIIRPPPVFFLFSVSRDLTMKLTWLPMIFLANTRLSPTVFASLHMFFLCHCCIYGHSSLKTSFSFFSEDSLYHTHTHKDWLIHLRAFGPKRENVYSIFLHPWSSMGGSIYGCNYRWQPPEVKQIWKTLWELLSSGKCCI